MSIDYEVNVIVCCPECPEHIRLEPDYKFTSYSGNSGHFACEESDIAELLKAEGWSEYGHCPSCLEREKCGAILG